MNEQTRIQIDDVDSFKIKALAWANQFSYCCLLDGNKDQLYKEHRFEWALAIDARRTFELNDSEAISRLKQFTNQGFPLFGYLSYDLKNQLEDLESNNPDFQHFSLGCFFQPRYLLVFDGTHLSINRNSLESSFLIDQIHAYDIPDRAENPSKIEIKADHSREEYIEKVEQLREHIRQGDCYEINFCINFYRQAVHIDPLLTFLQLNAKNKAAFSAFLKLNDQFILCSSPERFLRKKSNRLTSQPIKGTAKRGKNAQEDQQFAQQLQSDLKERAENVMIVDLVRNDLARSATTGSVEVEELFSVYPFEQANHLVSTIHAELDAQCTGIDALLHAFPMGSMTGAPKIRVMQLIEQYERFKRGSYSGTIGYFTPEGDFDFNVVIRSIIYHAQTGDLSMPAGSAITWHSDPEKEYEECLLKAIAMKESLVAADDKKA